MSQNMNLPSASLASPTRTLKRRPKLNDLRSHFQSGLPTPPLTPTTSTATLPFEPVERPASLIDLLRPALVEKLNNVVGIDARTRASRAIRDIITSLIEKLTIGAGIFCGAILFDLWLLIAVAIEVAQERKTFVLRPLSLAFGAYSFLTLYGGSYGSTTTFTLAIVAWFWALHIFLGFLFVLLMFKVVFQWLGEVVDFEKSAEAQKEARSIA